jgi:predicted type IV restriction endonuclease
MKEALLAFVKKVKAIHEKVRGNEQATKQSLIGPLFTLLGYDLTDPQECIPEYKADFGKERSVKPVDWAFYLNGRPIFLVEAKEAGRKLAGFDEQLGDYFAKEPEVKLGILTNGIMWRFFTDLTHTNVMDREPFVKWDVLNDEQPPYDFLTLLQKSQFKTELVRTFAQRKHEHNLLVNELARLLEPAPEFTRLAIANIETRNLTASVVESWKPVVASAIGEWAKQRALASVLTHSPSKSEADSPAEPDDEQDRPERYGHRRKFWETLLKRPKAQGTRHAEITPSEYSWIGAGSGVRGCPFNYAIGQHEGRVELWIDRGAGKGAENKDIFDRLHKHKDEIEQAFGGELSWQRLDDKQGCRIAYGTTGGYKSDEAKWPAIQDSMIEAMGRLEQALAAHLAKLKMELAAEGA